MTRSRLRLTAELRVLRVDDPDLAVGRIHPPIQVQGCLEFQPKWSHFHGLAMSVAASLF